MKRTLGYMIRSGSETLSEMLSWYELDNLPQSKFAIEQDFRHVFKNLSPRSAQLYRVMLVPVGKPRRKKTRQALSEGDK